MNYTLVTTTRNGLTKSDSFETAQELGSAFAFALTVGSKIVGYNTPTGGFGVVEAVGKSNKESFPLLSAFPTLEQLDEANTVANLAIAENAVNLTGYVAESTTIAVNTEETPESIPAATKDEPKKKGWFK